MKRSLCNMDPTTTKMCRYTTLQNTSLQKLHQPKAQQWQTRHAHGEENMTVVCEHIRPAYFPIIAVVVRSATSRQNIIHSFV